MGLDTEYLGQVHLLCEDLGSTTVLEPYLNSTLKCAMAKMMGYVNGQWDDFIIEWDSIVATLAVHHDGGERGILSAGSRLWE